MTATRKGLAKAILVLCAVAVAPLAPAATAAAAPAQASAHVQAEKATTSQARGAQYLLKNKGTGKCLRAGKRPHARVTSAKCNKKDDYQWWGHYVSSNIASMAGGSPVLLCIRKNKFTEMVGCTGNDVWMGGIPTEYAAIGSPNGGGSGKGCYLKMDKRGKVKCTPGWKSKYAKWRGYR